MEKYRFTEKGHRHELLVNNEWKRLTGITTVLSVISKPQLIQWSANMAVDYIRDNVSEIAKNNGDLEYLKKLSEEWVKILEQARKAHIQKRDKAGQLGTDIHAQIERIVKNAIENYEGIILFTNGWEGEEKQVQHFLNWSKDNKIKFIESELHLYSEKHFLGGICDFICEIDGDKWIGDIKTSNGIYGDAFWQMAGYNILMNEMKIYSDIKGYIILNLRKNGEFEEKRSISNEEHQKAFMACLDIYRIKQKTDSLVEINN